MHWLEQYNFILFDFDGLLVNTEYLHFQAYQKMCLDKGFVLPWDFPKYCSIAHASSEGLQREIYATFPELQRSYPSWDVLYGEKKRAYEELILRKGIELMPGVQEVLLFLNEKKIRTCVVTHSFLAQIEAIKEQIPLLQTIPLWVTRENYSQPKPAPDPYLFALRTYGKWGDRAIGFEDTLRGLQSMQQAGLEGVVVSSCLDAKAHSYIVSEKVRHWNSFLDIPTIC